MFYFTNFFIGKAKLASVPSGAAVAATAGGAAEPATEEKNGKFNICSMFYSILYNLF